MVKKFVIAVVCLVTIVALFGLPDRLDYDGFQVAIESVSASVADMADDLEFIEAMSGVIQHFDPSAHYVIGGVQNSDGSITVAIDIISQNANGFPVTTSLGYTFRNEQDALRLIDSLKPLTWGNGALDNPFSGTDGEALKSVGMVLSVLMVIVLLVINLLFDSVAVAVSLVDAFFYLIGL